MQKDTLSLLSPLFLGLCKNLTSTTFFYFLLWCIYKMRSPIPYSIAFGSGDSRW